MKDKSIKSKMGITLIALVVTIIVLLILAGVSLSLVAGGNGIIEKAGKAVDATIESTAVEEIELIIAEASMQYYLDETVTNETLTEYLVPNFNPRQTGSGANVTFGDNGNIRCEGANGAVILLEMNENGKVDIKERADGTKIEKTVTYSANGGTGNVPATQNFERKATVNVDFTTLPTRENYIFLGWATSSSATTAQYTESGTKTFIMGTSNITLYAVWEPRSGIAKSIIQASDYGDNVNYTANGVSDWKVFLNDGTNVYLIASDYVPRNKLSMTSDVEAGDGEYCVKGTSRDGLISWLATSTNWSNFANGTSGENSILGALATGGPTLSQFWASYNKKYGTDYSAEYQDLYESNNDTLYFPYKEVWNSCSSYWLASPISIVSNNVGLILCDGRVNSGYYPDSWTGVRPLVCLLATAKMTWNGNQWNLSN